MPSRDRVVFALLVAGLTIAFTLRPLDDADVGYHLSAGRLMATTWSWPSTNVLVFTAPDHPWVDLHWLFQLAVYGAWLAGGPTGCVLLAVALMLATVAVLYATARRHAPPALVALVLALALVVVSPRLVPRPELAGYLFLALFVWLLDAYPRSGGAIYAIVPLQLIWFNAHGTVPIGLGVIGCYWLGATVALLLPVPAGWLATNRCTPGEWRRLTLVGLLAAAVCVVNPWGLDGLRLPFDLLARMSGSVVAEWIGELRPPFQVGLPLIARAWFVMLVLTALSFLLNVRRWHLGQLFTVLMFGALSTRAFRHLPLFAFTAVPALAANLGPFWVRVAESGRRLPLRLAETTIGVGIALLVGAVVTNRFAYLANFENGFGVGMSRLRFPTEAVAFAREVGITGRPFNDTTTGGYLGWELLPEQPVFIDGRDGALPETFLRTYFALFQDPNRWPEVAARYRLDWAILYTYHPDRYPLARYLGSGHGWALVYYDEIASLYLPIDDAHSAVLARALRVFGERRQRRRAEPSVPARSFWDTIAVPVEEIWLQTRYGAFLRAIGLHAEAVDAYRRAVSLEPDEPWNRYELGLAYWASGDRDAALRELRNVTARYPDFTPARNALAKAAQAGAR